MSEKRLKIVYLINELGKGGSERQLYLLLSNMDLTQVEPIVVVFNPSTLANYQASLTEAGIRVIEMPSGKNTVIKRLLYLVSCLRSERTQVVHSWSVHDNPYASLAGWFTGVPVRAGSMRDSIMNLGFQSLSRLERYFSIKCCPYIFVNANDIRDELIKIKVPHDKIVLLQNCAVLSLPPADPPAKVLNLPANLENHRVIGTVCNIRKKKNIHIFVQGLAQVMQEGDDLVGVIIGQPIPDEEEYYQTIKALINDLGVADQILLLGFRDDAPALMHYLDIFCLLSDHEGTPNVVMEAMAAGVPVIATRVGGIPQLVEHGITGLLIPPRDLNGFVSSLRILLANPSKAAQMGTAAHQAIKSNYSCVERANELMGVYKQLLKERR